MNSLFSSRRLGGALLAAAVSVAAASCGTGQASLAAAASGGTAAAPAAPDLPAAGPMGGATLTAQPAALALEPASALWGIGRTRTGRLMLSVKLASDADECARLTAGTIHAGATGAWLNVVGPSFNDFTATVPPDFTADAASANASALDPSCAPTVAVDDAWATGGSIRVQLRADNHVTGSFDLRMGPAQAPLTGTFDAVACPAIGQLISNPTKVRTCQP